MSQTSQTIYLGLDANGNIQFYPNDTGDQPLTSHELDIDYLDACQFVFRIRSRQEDPHRLNDDFKPGDQWLAWIGTPPSPATFTQHPGTAKEVSFTFTNDNVGPDPHENSFNLVLENAGPFSLMIGGIRVDPTIVEKPPQ